jgi:hypothetical protein
MPQQIGIIQRRYDPPRSSAQGWSGCPAWIGISVQLPSESLSSMRRNRCPASVGICKSQISSAADMLADLYENDDELTSFTSLDGDGFA